MIVCCPDNFKREKHMPKDSQRFDVFNIKQRKDNKKPIWTKVGIGFENKDGSINVYLDMIPKEFEFHIRKQKPEDFDNSEEG